MKGWYAIKKNWHTGFQDTLFLHFQRLQPNCKEMFDFTCKENKFSQKN